MEDPRIDGETRRRLYNPYQGLNLPHHHGAPISIPTVPEFLFQEEARVQRRSWGENLTYYTGVGYLAGSTAGAALGLRSGLSAAEPGDTAKLRVSRVLNSCGAAGRRHGNRIGVLGLLYAGLESGMVQARDADDWVNSVAAGLGTGALFRAAGGARSAAVAGAIGGITAGAAVVGKQFVKRYVPI